MKVNMKRELANQDFEKILAARQMEMEDDTKKVFVDLFESGVFSLNESDKGVKLVQKLKFPILDDDGNVVIDKLTYSMRVSIKQVRSITKSMGSDGTDAAIESIAHVAAACGEPVAIIDRMDTSDAMKFRMIYILFVS